MTSLEEYADSYLYPNTISSFTVDLKGFSEQEKKLIDAADGTKTVQETIELSPLELVESYQVVFAALTMNLIEVREAPLSAPTEGGAATAHDDFSSKILKTYHQMATQNYFEIIGVTPTTTPEEIKEVYIKLAKKFHPDSFPSNVLPLVEKTASEIFGKINEAYQVLTDLNKRNEYIKSISAPAEEAKTADTVQDTLNAELQFQKGKVFLRKREFENAKTAMGWAVKLMPEEAEYLAYYGWLAFLASDDKKGPDSVTAVKFLKKAANINPTLELPHIFLGHIYKQQNLIDVATLHFKKALDINPENIDIKRELKILHDIKTRTDKGRRLGRMKK
jgi:hypothetical protein